MRVYHGSPKIVDKPVFGGGFAKNDYGPGFYTTEDPEMAREWAGKGREPPGFVNAYALDTTGLDILDLQGADYSVLNWIAVLLQNRTIDLDTDAKRLVYDYLIENFLPPYEQADIIVGYRADDSYFRYADSFVANGLPLSVLNRALKLGKLGLQVAVKSERAFSRLRFESVEEVDWPMYHTRFFNRDKAARDEWTTALRTAKPDPNDTYAIDIIRRGLKHGDPGLRAILP